jgi:hypothetical protein
LKLGIEADGEDQGRMPTCYFHENKV